MNVIGFTSDAPTTVPATGPAASQPAQPEPPAEPAPVEDVVELSQEEYSNGNESLPDFESWVINDPDNPYLDGAPDPEPPAPEPPVINDPDNPYVNPPVAEPQPINDPDNPYMYPDAAVPEGSEPGLSEAADFAGLAKLVDTALQEGRLPDELKLVSGMPLEGISGSFNIAAGIEALAEGDMSGFLQVLGGTTDVGSGMGSSKAGSAAGPIAVAQGLETIFNAETDEDTVRGTMLLLGGMLMTLPHPATRVAGSGLAVGAPLADDSLVDFNAWAGGLPEDVLKKTTLGELVQGIQDVSDGDWGGMFDHLLGIGQSGMFGVDVAGATGAVLNRLFGN